MELNHTSCYKAVEARDARFDGRFFTAVLTTGIYCRPICPAKTPKSENCRFFRCAAAAQEAGFRPCLRCRPELSPMLIEQLSRSNLVTKALRLIDEGALDDGTVDELAATLQVGGRHLRRLFTEELGASPLTVAGTRRVLFARQLIDQTELSMSDVALASGFGSIRRFNDVMLKTYNRVPREMRRSGKPASDSITTMRIPYHPPYNWEAMLEFLEARATPHVEEVVEDRYRRTISLQGAVGTIEVSHDASNQCLKLVVVFPKVSALTQIVAKVKQLFDIAANVNIIMEHFATDPILASRIARSPGLRVPGAWEPFELAVRAILGQQVSVQAATTMCGRIAAKYGLPLPDTGEIRSGTLTRIFPSAQTLAEADLTSVGLTTARAGAISTLASAVSQKAQLLNEFLNLEDAVVKLSALPGIGEWTAQYIAMRALREPDAFPGSDLGLLRATAHHGLTGPSMLVAHAEQWRPWRAYAAMYLWQVEPLLMEMESRHSSVLGKQRSGR